MGNKSASQQIDDIIQTYGGWKAVILSKLRAVVMQADPDATEEIKWKTASRPEGLPVWIHSGIICFAEIWSNNVKLVFFNGALMADSNKLFNARLNSSGVRAIEFHEGDTVDETALRKLVLEAIEIDLSKTSKH